MNTLRLARYRHAGLPLFAALVALLTTGCQSIPDISVWNKATTDVAAAVTEGFQSAASVNADLAARLQSTTEFEETGARYADAAAALNQRVDDYEKLFGAIADYSSSLAAIARAADNSQQTVDAVAGSLSTLVETAGGTKLAGAGFELGKSIANEIIKIKAAHDFGEAVGKADPAVGMLADLVEADLTDLAKTVSITKVEALRAAITGPLQPRIDYRNALLRRRDKLQSEITGSLTETTSIIASGPLADRASELATLERQLKDADSWYAPMSRELDTALANRAKSEQLALETRKAVDAWRRSHASLAAAVKERRLPESGRLAALAVRIRALVDDIKKKEN